MQIISFALSLEELNRGDDDRRREVIPLEN